MYALYRDNAYRITDQKDIRYRTIHCHCNGEEINTVFKILYSDLYEMTVKIESYYLQP